MSKSSFSFSECVGLFSSVYIHPVCNWRVMFTFVCMDVGVDFRVTHVILVDAVYVTDASIMRYAAVIAQEQECQQRGTTVGADADIIHLSNTFCFASPNLSSLSL